MHRARPLPKLDECLWVQTMSAPSSDKNPINGELVAFGKRLRFMRKRAVLTQTELASLLGVGMTTVSTWEHGTRAPDLGMVYRIVAELGCSVTFLVAGDGAASLPGAGGAAMPRVPVDSLVGRVNALEAAVFGPSQAPPPANEDEAATAEIDAELVKTAIEEVASENR